MWGEHPGLGRAGSAQLPEVRSPIPPLLLLNSKREKVRTCNSVPLSTLLETLRPVLRSCSAPDRLVGERRRGRRRDVPCSGVSLKNLVFLSPGCHLLKRVTLGCALI